MTLNRLLTDADRELFKRTIELFWEVCPSTMRRKIPRANCQQAFVFDTVDKFIKSGKTRILSVGCYDDTAYEFLYKGGLNIFGIDPAINTDLHTFRNERITDDKLKFDIIFSTSVIEHVKNDEEFLDDICKLLNKGGVGILTMDFSNDYRPGDKLPATDERFYTKNDLEFRLTKILTNNGCDLVDIPDWSGEPEFTHDGCNYSFATFVFRKN